MTVSVMKVLITSEEGKALIDYWWNRIECLAEMSCVDDSIKESEERIGRVQNYLNMIEHVCSQLKDADKEGEE